MPTSNTLLLDTISPLTTAQNLYPPTDLFNGRRDSEDFCGRSSNQSIKPCKTSSETGPHPHPTETPKLTFSIHDVSTFALTISKPSPPHTTPATILSGLRSLNYTNSNPVMTSISPNITQGVDSKVISYSTQHNSNGATGYSQPSTPTAIHYPGPSRTPPDYGSNAVPRVSSTAEPNAGAAPPPVFGSRHHPHTGAIVGGILGALVLIILVLFFLCRCKRRSKSSSMAPSTAYLRSLRSSGISSRRWWFKAVSPRPHSAASTAALMTPFGPPVASSGPPRNLDLEASCDVTPHEMLEKCRDVAGAIDRHNRVMEALEKRFMGNRGSDTSQASNALSRLTVDDLPVYEPMRTSATSDARRIQPHSPLTF
ncbi:hypothetical protein BXZ70DRAFT_130968 [Cristinia sonorae]|uniref:Uncharacterized protein n=1 Tax=Cristinia sonorae TaxID=1940300 RepID=A0A8K0UPX4_9AGAR|nr:hypothetical protein BXZ70DRAFT_130968 [Cristinia sonorae]